MRSALKQYKALVKKLSVLPDLSRHIQDLVENREGPSYTVVNPVVYNGALDEKGAFQDVRMILVADNPGRREQETGRYLVGLSGKIAEKFFRDNPELGIDFRKNVIILNKTPVHTPRTGEIRELCRLGGKDLEDALVSSQHVMAELLYAFWSALAAEGGGRCGAEPRRGGKRRTKFEAGGETSPLIWIIGYSEMKKGGIFEAYTERLKSLCAADPVFKKSIFFYRHFSMNQFTIDLHRQGREGERTAQSLERIGAAYRLRVLG